LAKVTFEIYSQTIEDINTLFHANIKGCSRGFMQRRGGAKRQKAKHKEVKDDIELFWQ